MPDFPGGSALDESDGGAYSAGGGALPPAGSVRCQYEDCWRVFNYKRSLDRHQRLKHGALYGATGQMCFYCNVPNCRRVFYKEANLQKHRRDVHGAAAPPMMDAMHGMGS